MSTLPDRNEELNTNSPVALSAFSVIVGGVYTTPEQMANQIARECGKLRLIPIRTEGEQARWVTLQELLDAGD